MEAVIQEGMALEFGTEELQKDSDIVMETVKRKKNSNCIKMIETTSKGKKVLLNCFRKIEMIEILLGKKLHMTIFFIILEKNWEIIEKSLPGIDFNLDRFH